MHPQKRMRSSKVLKKPPKGNASQEILLAKKLKVKGGRLPGVDDGLNELLGDISYTPDHGASICEGEDDVPSRKKHKRKRVRRSATLDKQSQEKSTLISNNPLQIETANSEPKKYIAPHLRDSTCGESGELIQIRRRVRGLLNRLSETNVESVTGEVAGIFRSIPRSDGFRIVVEEVVSSCVNGPRGNEQHAAVFAAFVAGMACLVGIDFGAKLLSSLALDYESEYAKDASLSLRNITLLLSYLYIFGVCSSDLIYDFLSVLSKRMTESDVSTVLAILQCCGMKLRSDDPAAMKDFILNIQSRVSELKRPGSSAEDVLPKINNKRMEFMLETICDIKNNKRREKEEHVHHTRIKNWLQKLKADDILLRGITWAKLIDPEKKGQWWFPAEIPSKDNMVEDVAVTIDKEILEAQKLVQLAAMQRMNTDIRRAIFCVIMSGEDYLDAFEKILRLDLNGKQDREVMRVLVECCLQEKVFNKYYVVLASKLCNHDKNHKFTLQYCLWDHFKELDSMELRRSMNLAKFIAEMLSSFTLSLALLKAVDLADLSHLTPNRIMHFRMLFEMIFENSESVIWNVFTRVAALPECELLNQNLQFFIKRFVITTNSGKLYTSQFRVAKKALDNVSGVLM